MIIDEAIKVNESTKVYLEEGALPSSAEAIQLGIEALKRIKEQGNLVEGKGRFLLPGETES